MDLSETARDFLLDLAHAQIAFGAVIGEGHMRITREQQHRAFVFFETLPRELRDCIYDLLYQEVEESMGYDVGDLEFHTRAIIPRLRFVSRQFKAEYDERISMNDLNQQAITILKEGRNLIDMYTFCSKTRKVMVLNLTHSIARWIVWLARNEIS